MARASQLFKAFTKRCEADKAKLAAIQASCKHKHIGHYGGNDTGPSHPRRICMDCGYEEVGSWWSSIRLWRRYESSTEETVLTSEFVKIITLNELCKFRPPQAIDPRPNKST